MTIRQWIFPSYLWSHCKKTVWVWAFVLFSVPVFAAGLTPYAGKKLSQASVLAQNGQLNKAIQVLTDFSPKASYDVAFVQRMLGIYYWQADQASASIASLRRALSQKVLEPQAQWQTYRMLGDILYSQQQFSSSVKAYRNTLAVRYQPTSKEKAQFNKDVQDIYLRLAAAYYQQQNWAQVRSWIVKYRAPDRQKQLQALRMQMVAEYHQKQWKNVEQTLSRLIHLEPNNKAWWQQQISAQLQQNKRQSALETYALAKKQKVPFALNDYKALSQLYAQNNIPERGARILEEMFAAFPNSKTLAEQKTQAYYYQIAREWDKAIGVWEGLAQTKAEYYWPLVKLYVQQKAYPKAARIINKAQPYAEQSEFSLLKVRLLYRLEQYNDALAEAKRLDEVQPSDSAKTWIAYLQNKLTTTSLNS